MATKPLVSDYLVPPGHYVREALEHYGMTQRELAERMGRPVQMVSEIVNAKKEIIEETAFELESVLGTPAHVWMNLESLYRYGIAEHNRREQLAEQEELAREYPYNELAKLGQVPPTRNARERVENLIAFFGIANLKLVKTNYSAAFRKSPKYQPSPHALAAWLRIAERAAEKMDLPPFDKAELKKAIPDLRRATRTHGEIDDVIQGILRPAGIAFVTAPHLKKTYANGATFWHAGRPVIILSARGAHADIVWFTLFHEIGHIMLHDRSDTFIEGLGITSKEEKEADRFAADTLISPGDWDMFHETTDYSPEHVLEFAKLIEIAPDIIVGRLMHEDNAYDGYPQLRRLRGKMGFSD